MKKFDQLIILFFILNLIIFANSSQCEQEIEKIFEDSILKRVESYSQHGNGLDWFDSFKICKETSESTYSVILWKIDSSFNAFYGFCIPQACDQIQSEKVLSGLVKEERFKIRPSDEVSFSIFNFKKSLEMNISGKIFVIFFSVHLFFTVFFSFFNPFLEKDSIFNHFSIFQNSSKFLMISNSSNFQFFDGIRSISSILLLFYHVFCTFETLPLRNRVEINSFLRSFPYTLIVSITFVVDIFFLISGFLMSFLTIPEIRKNQTNFSWLKFILKRFIRYIPCYYFLIGLERSLGGGKPELIQQLPLYSLSTNTINNWFHNLFLVQNLFSKKDFPHLVWTWSIACDFQFYLISSFILFLYTRGKNYGYAASFILLFSSITYTGLVSYSFNLSPSSLKTSQDPIQWNIIYGKPFPRIGTFLIGLIFGFVFLELSQKQQGRKSRAFEFQRFEFFFKRVILNDRFFQIFCLVGGFVLTGIIAGPYYLQYYGEESLSCGFKAVWLALQRPVFGAFVGVFILFMAFGYLELVRRFLSMRIFQYFSKISFCFYLVHPISFAVVNSDEIIDWSIFVVVFRSVYCFFISVFIALVCEIFIQMPLVGLGERILVGKFRK